MDIEKAFLGEDQESSPIDFNSFNSLFSFGVNKNLIIIKSKAPIPYQDEIYRHTHTNYEFTIPLSHSPNLLIEDKTFTLPRRNIFPCNPGQYHGCNKAVYNHRIIAFQIAPRDLQEISALLFGKNDIEFLNTPSPFDPQHEKLIDLFIYESQNKQAGYEFILEHLAGMLSAYILRTLKSNVNIQNNDTIKPMKKEISRTLDFLRSNVNTDFSLNDIADTAGLSKYHFIRVFKRETGKTPYQYYLDIKIEKAIELIKTKKYSITEICFMCGFKNHSHFSKMFIKKLGMSPSQFQILYK